MRVRSSAVARRRSRCVSRSLLRARSTRSACRRRRARTWSPATQAPPQTTTPNRIGLVGNPLWANKVLPTWIANMPSTTTAVRRIDDRVRSSVATKKSAIVGPNGGPSP